MKQGYNDLATTDPHLLKEWDYEKNTDVLPTQISRHSMRYVWWRCAFGHSRRDRISNRTIEHKRCPSCESDFEAVLPQLLIKYYANQQHIAVAVNDEDTIGVLLDTYIPDLKLAFIVSYKGTQREDAEVNVIAHLCKQRGITLVRLKLGKEREEICSEIRRGFTKSHIFITSDSQKDLQQISEQFFRWRERSL